MMSNCGSCIKNLDDQDYELSYSDNEVVEDIDYWNKRCGSGFGEISVCLILFSEIFIGSVPDHTTIVGEYSDENIPYDEYDLKCNYIDDIYNHDCKFQMKYCCKESYNKLHYILKNFVHDYKSKFRSRPRSLTIISSSADKLILIDHFKYLLIELYNDVKKLCEKIGGLYRKEYDPILSCSNLRKDFYELYVLFDTIMYSTNIFRQIPSHANILSHLRCI